MRTECCSKYESLRVIYSCCVEPGGGEKSHLCVHVACTVLSARPCAHYCLFVSECVMQAGEAALHISEPARCTSVVTLVTTEEKQTREREVDQLAVLRKNSRFNLPSDASRRTQFHACVFCSIKPPLFSVKLIIFCPPLFLLMDSVGSRFSIHNKGMLWVFKSLTR